MQARLLAGLAGDDYLDVGGLVALFGQGGEVAAIGVFGGAPGVGPGVSFVGAEDQGEADDLGALVGRGGQRGGKRVPAVQAEDPTWLI
jgi:hypothetical protein